MESTTIRRFGFDKTLDSKINQHRSTFAYRGASDESWKIENGISRFGKPYKNMGQNLLKQFKRYTHKQVVERDTERYWLSIAQHHGLSTHLIDWTNASMIVSHIATENFSKYDKDGAVWRQLMLTSNGDFMQKKSAPPSNPAFV